MNNIDILRDILTDHDLCSVQRNELELAIAALEKQREMEPRVLTVDELLKWNANVPFYIEGLKKPYESRWVLIDEPMSSDKYWMTHAYHVERYGKEWLAYDREPSNRKDD